MTSYRQAIEEVHQNDDNEEDESEEEDVAEGRVEGDVAELKLADEHGEGLDKAKAKVVKEGIISLGATIVFVKQDVESEPEGKEEQGIPDEEGGEGLENPVEHCGIDVVGGESRMSAHHGHQLYPAKDIFENNNFVQNGRLFILP